MFFPDSSFVLNVRIFFYSLHRLDRSLFKGADPTGSLPLRGWLPFAF